jgi:KUP system potassium uptake protein
MTQAPKHKTPKHKSTSKNATFSLLGLSLAALGIVFGDIGTSVLYAMNEIFFNPRHQVNLNTANILGVVSLAIWALTLVITVKYVMLVLRADNKGEGGVFSLYSLLRTNKRWLSVVLTTGLFVLSAGLLFGDGLITPAISVLSAVEGLAIFNPGLDNYVIGITTAILIALFAIQSKGTGQVGKFFGPVILLWMLCIALLGLNQIIHTPQIFAAFNPMYAFKFIGQAKVYDSLLVLGSLILVVTGGEALFADMGHFGKKPIRLSWLTVVYPSLLLNYMGQGAYLLTHPAPANGNIFYSLVPHSLLLPVVVLATLATVIASQALISGVFSLTAQGIGLGFLPRLRVLQTHIHHEGQIYVPFINWSLLLGCVILVVTFESSTNLASAYGLAVASDMLITSLAMVLIAKDLWRWSWLKALSIFIPLIIVDLIFFSANSLKFFEGGFLPVGIGVIMFFIMKSWEWGRRLIAKNHRAKSTLTVNDVVKTNQQDTNYFPRSILVLSSTHPEKLSDSVPLVFEVFWQRYKMMPKNMVFVSIARTSDPYVTKKARYDLHVFENDKVLGAIASLKVNYGYMETPDFADVLHYINDHPDVIAHENIKDWLIFAGQERLLKIYKKINLWDKIRYQFFKAVYPNTIPAYTYFGLANDLRLVLVQIPISI